MATNALDELLEKWNAENNATKESKMSVTDQRQRQFLTSSGEHIAAVLKLGSTYSAESYLAAVDEARELGRGQAYADAVLGPDVDSLLSGIEDADDETMRLAAGDLKARGIDPERASYRQLADALLRVAS